MFEQLQRLAVNGTWRLVPRPSGKNIIGCRWVFRIKRDAQGKILKYKACLVAQGYTQVPGIDYHDTFAPVAKLTSNSIVLALAARNDWEIQQMDVKDAYLNAPLDEEIYIQQPDGFSQEGKELHVCLLQKSLYGLKQASRLWYERLREALVRFGFTRCQVEHCVFYKHKDGHLAIIVVAVDDLTLTASSVALMHATKAQLKTKFNMTDDGDIHWLLGIKITHDRNARTISLSQKSYIDSMLSRYHLNRAKLVSIPMESGLKLSIKQCPHMPEEIERMKRVPYKEGIGSLLYAALATRPDIAFASSILGQFAQNPGRIHWEALKRIMRYLKGTSELELVLGGKPGGGLSAYSDADFASQEHRHSISGYAVLIDGGAVSWSSKKQSVIALSTTEAEYIAETHASKEISWTRFFLNEIARPLTSPTMLFSDNQGAIDLTENGQYHARTKHIDICYHFIREAVANEVLIVIHCPSEDMPADIFTKPLTRVKINKFCEELGVRSA